MANKDYITHLGELLENLMEDGLYAEDLPISACRSSLNVFIKDYIPPTFYETLVKLKSEGKNPSSLDAVTLSRLYEFIGDYQHKDELNVIKVDCKLDMAIPKESLQENLQLLIDRHGVQEVSNLIEKLANGDNVPVSLNFLDNTSITLNPLK